MKINNTEITFTSPFLQKYIEQKILASIDMQSQILKYSRKTMSSQIKNVTTLQLCMFHRIRPIVLYSHRLKTIQKGVIIQTVHLLRIILQQKKSYQQHRYLTTKTTRTLMDASSIYPLESGLLHLSLSTCGRLNPLFR